MRNMELLLVKGPVDKIRLHVLPMVYNALESTDTDVQSLALTVIPSFQLAIDFGILKDSLIPRIQAICLKSDTLVVRIGSLVCLGKLLVVMDKWLFNESLIPFLEHVPHRDPGVIMAIIGIYTEVLFFKSWRAFS